MGQATTAMRCGSRRRSLLAGFMMSGTPHDVFSFLYFMVVLVLVTSTSVCTGMASVSRRMLRRIMYC